jgi:hypothetical protein
VIQKYVMVGATGLPGALCALKILVNGQIHLPDCALPGCGGAAAWVVALEYVGAACAPADMGAFMIVDAHRQKMPNAASERYKQQLHREVPLPHLLPSIVV